MAECTHDCSSCGEKCEKRDFHVSLRAGSSVKKVIGIVSGKGGVGKSLVTSLLAARVNKDGFRSAILDADITGPSIPKAFGLKPGCIEGSELGMFPAKTKTGLEVMSVNLLVDDETKPVVWRGPVIAGTVKQFWTDVVWNEVDYIFDDMPPGTGEVPLTVFQSLPIDGIIIVTSPQELVSMIVEKAVNMAKLMDINVLGFVENYSYIACPDCGKIIRPYGKSNIAELAKANDTRVLAELPIDPELTSVCDKGVVELFEGEYLDRCADYIEDFFKN